LLKSRDFEGYGLQPVHKCPDFNAALAAEGMFAGANELLQHAVKVPHRIRASALATSSLIMGNPTWASNNGVKQAQPFSYLYFGRKPPEMNILRRQTPPNIHKTKG
jgi:hypothetical protein